MDAGTYIFCRPRCETSRIICHRTDINRKKASDRIQLNTLVKYLEKAYKIVQDVDAFLLDNYIGEFQAIYAYHQHRDEFAGGEIDRALELKKYYGKHDQTVGKTFCKGLVNYYEEL